MENFIKNFFAGNYPGPAFEFLGTAHLVALACLVLLNLLLIGFKRAGENTKYKIRWTLALILWGNEIGWHYWNYAVGKWTLQTMLPLQVCSILVWLGALMLVTKNYRIYEFMYLMGIGGAIQALATPDLGIYGFPHFRFFQTFLSHGLIVTSAIYMTVCEGLRPTWKSLLRVAIWMNLYLIPVYFLNIYLGSNYLMINHKPETASLLDLLPEWPIYILYMEALGVVTFLILYLPFMFKDLYAKSVSNRDNACARKGCQPPGSSRRPRRRCTSKSCAEDGAGSILPDMFCVHTITHRDWKVFQNKVKYKSAGAMAESADATDFNNLSTRAGNSLCEFGQTRGSLRQTMVIPSQASCR